MPPTADDRLAAARQGDVLLVEDTGFEVQVMRSQESLLPYRNSDAAGARPLPGRHEVTIVHRHEGLPSRADVIPGNCRNGPPLQDTPISLEDTPIPDALAP